MTHLHMQTEHTQTDLEKIMGHLKQEGIDYFRKSGDIRIHLGPDRTYPISLPTLSWDSGAGIHYRLLFGYDDAVHTFEIRPLIGSSVILWWYQPSEFDRTSAKLQWEQTWKSEVGGITSITHVLELADRLPIVMQDLAPLREMGLAEFAGLDRTLEQKII